LSGRPWREIPIHLCDEPFKLIAPERAVVVVCTAKRRKLGGRECGPLATAYIQL
jgi:hypothetical protein